MLKQTCQDLSDAMEARDWERSDRLLQYLVGLIQRRGSSEGGMAEIADCLNDLRIRTMCEHDIDQRLGPVQIAWMLAGVCSVVNQAVPTSA